MSDELCSKLLRCGTVCVHQFNGNQQLQVASKHVHMAHVPLNYSHMRHRMFCYAA